MDDHVVRCPWCDRAFDLLRAGWCGHGQARSKVCPGCARCLCEHPGFPNPWLWTEAPEGFREHGIEKLFVLYR